MFPNILVVDDDISYCVQVERLLSMHNFEVIVAHDASLARQLLRQQRVDLILLDWNLLDERGQARSEDGLSFLKNLRNSGDKTAVIMVTTNLDYEDSAKSLESGADDYIRKPFEHKDLIGRIRAVLRRIHTQNFSDRKTHHSVTFNNWVFDFDTHKLSSPDGTEVPLRASESLLLSIFLLRPKEVLDRQTLVQFVFGPDAESDHNSTPSNYDGLEEYHIPGKKDPFVDLRKRAVITRYSKLSAPTSYNSRSIDNIMVELRKKLGDEHIIMTIRGRGYMFAARVVECAPHVQRA